MGFVVQSVGEADLTRYAEIVGLACNDDVTGTPGGPSGDFAQWLYPGFTTADGQKTLVERSRPLLGLIPPQNFIKVVDEANGGLAVGFGLFLDIPQQPDKPGELSGDFWDDEKDKAYAKAMYDDSHARRWKVYGTGPTIELQALIVDPQYFRRGVGSMIISRCTEMADERGWQVHLDATLLAKRLYERFGFVVDEEVVRARPAGWEHRPPTIYYSMIRPAQSGLEE